MTITYTQRDLFWMAMYYAISFPCLIYCVCKLSARFGEWVIRKLEGRK